MTVAGCRKYAILFHVGVSLRQGQKQAVLYVSHTVRSSRLLRVRAGVTLADMRDPAEVVLLKPQHCCVRSDSNFDCMASSGSCYRKVARSDLETPGALLRFLAISGCGGTKPILRGICACPVTCCAMEFRVGSFETGKLSQQGAFMGYGCMAAGGMGDLMR